MKEAPIFSKSTQRDCMQLIEMAILEDIDATNFCLLYTSDAADE